MYLEQETSPQNTHSPEISLVPPAPLLDTRLAGTHHARAHEQRTVGYFWSPGPVEDQSARAAQYEERAALTSCQLA